MIYFIWDFYWRHKEPIKVNAEVISVGNIAVGGSGKTSLTEFIAKRLLEKNKKVAVIARGYGRLESGAVTITASVHCSWEKCGDEPAALARTVPGLSIYVDSDKTKAAAQAVSDGFNVIIIDDGFQHRKLQRDVDIACLDAALPFGNGLVLPSGNLREPRGSIKRADLAVFFDDSSNHQPRTPILPERIPIFRAHKRVIGARNAKGKIVDLSGKVIIAFCGLANPASFQNSIRETGCVIASFMTFRDHHRYRRREIERIAKLSLAHGAEACVTTLKDIVKLETLWPSSLALYYLDIVIELENEAEFFRLIGV
jgi:tetraacyldisaccharide 4'-kinase